MLLKNFIYLLSFIWLPLNNSFCKNEYRDNSNLLKAERLSNFGNFNILKYRKFKKAQTKYNDVNNPELSEFNKIYDAVDKIKFLNLCLQNMVLVTGKKDFKFGFSCDGNLPGKIIDIDPFFLSSTKVTRDQYYKFIETVNLFLKNMRNNNGFGLYMSEEKIKKKFLKNKKKSKNKKNDKNLNNNKDNENNDDKFKNYLDDYFALRKDMFANLDENYLHFLMPRFEDYKTFPFKDDKFMDEYIFNEEYGDYPIILVNYYQYVEYCKWQTLCINEFLFKHLKSNERVMVIFYPVSYEEYFYAACCGDPNNIYSCGASPVNNDSEPLFNFNNAHLFNNKIRITEVRKFPKSQFNMYDLNGNTRVWFGSKESDYAKLSTDINVQVNKNQSGLFKRLLDEGIPKKGENKRDIEDNFRMTSKGSCNSRLRETQNGRFTNEHVLYASPFLGFTLAAKIILDE